MQANQHKLLTVFRDCTQVQGLLFVGNEFLAQVSSAAVAFELSCSRKEIFLTAATG